jgi:hypothetical protein
MPSRGPGTLPRPQKDPVDHDAEGVHRGTATASHRASRHHCDGADECDFIDADQQIATAPKVSLGVFFQ